MRLGIIGGIVITLLTVACSSSSSPKALFNGVNLDGWKVYGTEKWFVNEDRLLVSESGPDKQYGYLATDKSYKDFELTAEFKQEADGNSGIFFRSNIEGIIVSGWQAEIAPPKYFTGGIYESYGRKWLIKPEVEKDKYLKFGDWNTMKLRVVGNNVTTWLNGHEMISLSDDIIGQGNGKIALQIHDGGGIKVFWKNINLQEL